MLVGSIYMFAGSTAPEGFLFCDGSAVSRSTYSDLFEVIGTTYGAGNGSTTFNLPDLSGKVAMGASQNYAIGSTGGEEEHVLLESEIPAHVHEVPAHGHLSSIDVKTPELQHSSITQPAFNYNRPNGSVACTDSSTNGSYAGTSSSTATRTADLKIDNHPATACTKTGGISDCPAFDTEDTGSNTGHSNMQPYLTMNYIIYTGA